MQSRDRICSMPLPYGRLLNSSMNKLQVIQNAALRTATGCTQDTHIQHLHDEPLILPIHKHLQLQTSQYKQKSQHQSHPLHKHTSYFNTPRLKHYLQQWPLHNKHFHRPHRVTTTDIKNKHANIHTSIVSRHQATRGNNKILRPPPPHISSE